MIEGTRGAPRQLRLWLLPIVLLSLQSCLLDDEATTLSFLAMALPDRIAVGESVEVDVHYGIGPESCFEAERIQVTVEGSRIRIAGTGARGPGPCGDTTATGRSVVRIPPLDPGEYTVVAGDLRAVITVAGDAPGERNRLVCAGGFHPDNGGCELRGNDMVVALIGFPPGLDTKRGYLVQALIGTDDPCGLARHGPVDYFATVREMTPLD